MAKCAECGFLTLREKDTGKLREVDADYRVLGRVPPISGYEELHNYPICFAMAWELMPEVEEAAQKQFEDHSDDWGKYVLVVITRERECSAKCGILGFTKYQQGFTPKEHKEMLDRQWMIEREDKRDTDIREWQVRESRSNRKWRMAEFFIALIALILVVMAAYIERGGQPTINIITQNPPEVTIEQEP